MTNMKRTATTRSKEGKAVDHAIAGGQPRLPGAEHERVEDAVGNRRRTAPTRHPVPPAPPR